MAEIGTLTLTSSWGYQHGFSAETSQFLSTTQPTFMMVYQITIINLILIHNTKRRKVFFRIFFILYLVLYLASLLHIA